MAVTGFACAVSVRVGYSLGAGQPWAAKRATWTAWALTMCLQVKGSRQWRGDSVGHSAACGPHRTDRCRACPELRWSDAHLPRPSCSHSHWQVVVATTVVSCRHGWAKVFTNSEPVIEGVSSLLPIFAIRWGTSVVPRCSARVAGMLPKLQQGCAALGAGQGGPSSGFLTCALLFPTLPAPSAAACLATAPALCCRGCCEAAASRPSAL